MIRLLCEPSSAPSKGLAVTERLRAWVSATQGEIPISLAQGGRSVVSEEQRPGAVPPFNRKGIKSGG